MGKITTQLQTAKSLRQQLRDSSMPVHSKLEDIVEAGLFFETPEGYARWLNVMQGFHSEFAAEYDDGSRRLGMSEVSNELLDALAKDTGRYLSSQLNYRSFGPESIGVAYVFEGSAMGARLLRKQLAKVPHVPMAYLDTLIETSHVRWPKIKRALADLDTDPDPIVTRAVNMFEELSYAFSKVES